jgi:MFS family permease
LAGFLDKERTVAGSGFNRWLVPPAALAIHLCIGMAYGFTALLSLFNIGGRFFWARLSDRLGRKLTYGVFFVLGGVLGPVVVNYMRKYQLGSGHATRAGV